MRNIYNSNLVNNSQKLRKNMTKEEKHLWYDFLKNLPITVNRQKVIGNYIVDFFCSSARLVIELDGSQHYTDSGQAKDIERDNFFKSLGIEVLRYSNLDINCKFESVCSDILKHIDERLSVKNSDRK